MALVTHRVLSGQEIPTRPASQLERCRRCSLRGSCTAVIGNRCPGSDLTDSSRASPCDALETGARSLRLSRSQARRAWRTYAAAPARPDRWRATVRRSLRKLSRSDCDARAEYMARPRRSNRGRGGSRYPPKRRDEHDLSLWHPFIHPADGLLEPRAVEHAAFGSVGALCLKLGLQLPQLRLGRRSIRRCHAALNGSADLAKRGVERFHQVRRISQISVLQHYSRNACVSK